MMILGLLENNIWRYPCMQNLPPKVLFYLVKNELEI